MSPFDRKALKKQAKKTAKVAKEHAEATMDLDGLAVVDDDMEAALPATSRPVKAKKKISKLPAKGIVQPVVISEEAEKEMEFMAFLNQVGGELLHSSMLKPQADSCCPIQRTRRMMTPWSGIHDSRDRCRIL